MAASEASARQNLPRERAVSFPQRKTSAPLSIRTETVLTRNPLSMRVFVLFQTAERLLHPPQGGPTEKMQGRRPVAAGDAQRQQGGQFG